MTAGQTFSVVPKPDDPSVVVVAINPLEPGAPKIPKPKQVLSARAGGRVTFVIVNNDPQSTYTVKVDSTCVKNHGDDPAAACRATMNVFVNNAQVTVGPGQTGLLEERMAPASAN